MSATLWLCQNSYWTWIFILDLPTKNVMFHSYERQKSVEEGEVFLRISEDQCTWSVSWWDNGNCYEDCFKSAQEDQNVHARFQLDQLNWWTSDVFRFVRIKDPRRRFQRLSRFFHQKRAWSAVAFIETFLETLYLVGGWPTPLKNMKVNWDYYSQYMENIKVMFQTSNQFCCCFTSYHLVI